MGDQQQHHGPHSTLGQRLIVFFLVIGVGVLFGMGGSVALLQGGQSRQEIMLGIDTMQQRQHARMMATVQQLERGSAMPMNDDYMAWLQRRALLNLVFAKLAEEEGLLPRGDTRDRLLRDFVQQPLPRDPGRSILDAIDDRRGSDQAINLDALADFLAVRHASQAYSARHTPAPALDEGNGELFARASERMGDQVVLGELQLSAERFLPELEVEVEDDEEAIEQAYEELKYDRFSVPVSLRVVAVVGDPAVIVPKLTIPEEAVRARYQEVKESRYLLSPEQPASEDGEPPADDAAEEPPTDDAAEEPPTKRYRPFEEVREEILAQLQDEAAGDIAERLLVEIDSVLNERGLTGDETEWPPFLEAVTAVTISGEDDKRLTGPVSAVIHQEVRAIKVAPPRKVVLKLEDGDGSQLARIDDAAFFDREEGHISLNMSASDNNRLHLLVRLRERVPASERPLEEVRDEVVRYVAAQRSWPRLLAAAEDLRSAAEEAGGLEAYVTDEVEAAWNSQFTERQTNVLTDLEGPSEELDGFDGETHVAFDLARAPKPVVLLRAAPDGDVPRVTVAQAKSYQPAELREEMSDYFVRQYRSEIANYMSQMLNEQISERQR